MKQSNPKNHKIIITNMPESLGLQWSINPYLHPQNTFSNYNVWQNYTQQQAFNSINLNAVNQLENLFKRPEWDKKTLSLSGNVDCYSKLEGKLRLTRAILKLCIQYQNPVCIITRNDLILRDIDLLQTLQKNNLLQVLVQINTTKNSYKAKLEPSSTNYENRIALIKMLADRHIPTSVMIAPIIKNLTEDCVPKIMADAQYVGACEVYTSYLSVKKPDTPLFNAWLQAHFPDECKHASLVHI